LFTLLIEEEMGMIILLIAVGLVIFFTMLTFWKKLNLWKNWGIIGFSLGCILAVVRVKLTLRGYAFDADLLYFIFCFPLHAAYKIPKFFIPEFHLSIILLILYYTLFGMAIGKSFDSGFRNKNKLAKIFFFFLIFIFVLTILFPLFVLYALSNMM
jgi:hypothetical protein